MSTIPGIKYEEFESFVDETGRLVNISDGKITYDLDMPPYILNSRKKELSQDRKAQHALFRMRLFSNDERLLQFCKCRYGGMDNTPDTVKYRKNTPDYWDCGNKGKCSYENVVCKPLMAAHGKLSKCEIEVIKLIAQDLADKEIADKLGVFENTIHTHRYHITKKIGCHSKNGIVAFAYENGLINK